MCRRCGGYRSARKLDLCWATMQTSYGGFEGAPGFARQCAPEVLEADQSSQQHRRFRDASFPWGRWRRRCFTRSLLSRKDRRVHCQSRRRGVAAAHHRREVFLRVLRLLGSFTTRTVSRWSWIQTSTLSVCDVLKHCWSYIKDVTAAMVGPTELAGSNSAARCCQRLLKKRNCEVDRVESGSSAPRQQTLGRCIT